MMRREKMDDDDAPSTIKLHQSKSTASSLLVFICYTYTYIHTFSMQDDSVYKNNIDING